jgi:small subunit ribosomal protein S8e
MSLAKKAEAVTHTSERAAKAAATRAQTIELESHLKEQFGSGRLLACISSRPGQCGRADGYILEGKELEFYLRKTNKKK